MVRLYFTARDGVTYRVYDAQLMAGRYHDMGVGAPAAVYRVFVTEKREQLAYRFTARDRRDVEKLLLEEQLAWAKGDRERLAALQGPLPLAPAAPPWENRKPVIARPRNMRR